MYSAVVVSFAVEEAKWRVSAQDHARGESLESSWKTGERDAQPVVWNSQYCETEKTCDICKSHGRKGKV